MGRHPNPRIMHAQAAAKRVQMIGGPIRLTTFIELPGDYIALKVRYKLFCHV